MLSDVPDRIRELYGIEEVFEYEGVLGNGGENIRLVDDWETSSTKCATSTEGSGLGGVTAADRASSSSIRSKRTIFRARGPTAMSRASPNGRSIATR